MTERLDRRGCRSESRERRKEREDPEEEGGGLCSSESCWEQIRQLGSRRD